MINGILHMFAYQVDSQLEQQDLPSDVFSEPNHTIVRARHPPILACNSKAELKHVA